MMADATRTMLQAENAYQLLVLVIPVKLSMCSPLQPNQFVLPGWTTLCAS